MASDSNSAIEPIATANKAAKTWCGTINNPTEAERNWLISIAPDDVNRIVASDEVGEGTEENPEGTPHIQFQVTFKRAYRLTQLKKLCPRAHWEIAKAGQDFLYPNKVGSTVFLSVNNTRPGKRNDLESVAQQLRDGATPDTLLDKDENLTVVARYPHFVNHLASHYKKRKGWSPPEVFVHYGSTGTGKTREAFAGANPDDLWVWNPSMSQWFDGYYGQSTVIFDEFRGQLPFGLLLNVLDGHTHMKVPVKGGFTHWSPSKIYLTSPLPPAEWYKDLAGSDKYDQLKRRITKTIHFTGTFDPLVPSATLP